MHEIRSSNFLASDFHDELRVRLSYSFDFYIKENTVLFAMADDLINEKEQDDMR